MSFIKIPKHINRIGFAFLDQIVISLQNFLLSLFLIKTVTIEEFGHYNFIIPITLLITSVQNAIFNMPLMVSYWSKDENERESYVSSLIVIQIYIIIGIAILISIIVCLLYILGLVKIFFIELILTGFVATVGLLSREFLRNLYFSKELPQKTVGNDLVFLLLQMIFVLSAYLFLTVSIQIILILIGISAFLSSGPELYNLIIHNKYIVLKKHLIENWQYSKWILIGVIVTHIQTYGYIYILGILLNPATIGLVAAARLFMVPLQLLSVGYAKIAIPRGTRLMQENLLKKFFREEITISIFFSALVFFYIVVLFNIPASIIDQLLSNEYNTAKNFLIYFGIAAIFGMFIRTGTNGLQVMKKFKLLSKINILTMVISLALTFLLTHFWGVEGALNSMNIISAISAIIVWKIFISSVRKK